MDENMDDLISQLQQAPGEEDDGLYNASVSCLEAVQNASVESYASLGPEWMILHTFLERKRYWLTEDTIDDPRFYHGMLEITRNIANDIGRNPEALEWLFLVTNLPIGSCSLLYSGIIPTLEEKFPILSPPHRTTIINILGKAMQRAITRDSLAKELSGSCIIEYAASVLHLFIAHEPKKEKYMIKQLQLDEKDIGSLTMELDLRRPVGHPFSKQKVNKDEEDYDDDNDEDDEDDKNKIKINGKMKDKDGETTASTAVSQIVSSTTISTTEASSSKDKTVAWKGETSIWVKELIAEMRSHIYFKKSIPEDIVAGAVLLLNTFGACHSGASYLLANHVEMLRDALQLMEPPVGLTLTLANLAFYFENEDQVMITHLFHKHHVLELLKDVARKGRVEEGRVSAICAMINLNMIEHNDLERKPSPHSKRVFSSPPSHVPNTSSQSTILSPASPHIDQNAPLSAVTSSSSHHSNSSSSNYSNSSYTSTLRLTVNMLSLLVDCVEVSAHSMAQGGIYYCPYHPCFSLSALMTSPKYIPKLLELNIIGALLQVLNPKQVYWFAEPELDKKFALKALRNALCFAPNGIGLEHGVKETLHDTILRIVTNPEEDHLCVRYAQDCAEVLDLDIPPTALSQTPSLQSFCRRNLRRIMDGFLPYKRFIDEQGGEFYPTALREYLLYERSQD
eukprot:m.9823 g.9823  ORF g.9823 m.9823 type:complete len:679 (-) comp3561_c0_seq1:98-2134(-)